MEIEKKRKRCRHNEILPVVVKKKDRENATSMKMQKTILALRLDDNLPT